MFPLLPIFPLKRVFSEDQTRRTFQHLLIPSIALENGLCRRLNEMTFSKLGGDWLLHSVLLGNCCWSPKESILAQLTVTPSDMQENPKKSGRNPIILMKRSKKDWFIVLFSVTIGPQRINIGSVASASQLHYVEME